MRENAFFLFGAAIIATILVIRLSPVLPKARALLATMHRAQAILKMRHASDHWKERAAATLARKLMAASISFCFWLLCGLSPLLLAWQLAPRFSVDFAAALTSWPLRGALVFIAILTNMIFNVVKRRL
jgi:hypothetical protein